MSSPPTEPTSFLFVCLGNICRSPLAEAAFNHVLTQCPSIPKETVGIVDSAGTAGYHVGERPDSRSINLLKNRGLSTPHRARRVTPDDFLKFDYIFGMDRANVRDLLSVREEAKRKNPGKKLAWCGLWGGFPDGEKDGSDRGEVVEDPYYGGPEGFEENWKQAVRFSWGTVERVWGVKKE
ncbi:phosphotyrosine protein phosphatase [Ascobolus immersus RN42]|uniref:Phosphotyrosine protein phosphatase n=1 Tax=Ascobolus immersus RN42 TaxID=1160509 RepID=A0A3N4I159_ASCIM|nr:phosphotyrosine protein phosphatase [Ascobolus immersus RN42]